MQKQKLPDYFEDLRPYNETETLEVLQKLSQDTTFIKALKQFFPEKNEIQLVEKIQNLKSIFDFQTKIMYPAIKFTEAKITTSIKTKGIDILNKNQTYVYMSNHRDIALDVASFQCILVEAGFNTTEITFGNNLMKNPLVTDVGKINKMFKVYRKGKPKELMQRLIQLSEYISYTQNIKKESIWIAQRGGRTKDGDDKTQYGVLKMLTNSRKGSVKEKLKDLRIVPITLSYEFEPNDYLKVREIFLSREAPYVKAPNEDLNSILDGLTSYKGKVNYVFGKPLTEEFDEISEKIQPKEQMKQACYIIDQIMYQNYKLYPNNYIAADLLRKSSDYKKNYTDADKATFLNYMTERLKKIEFSNPELEIIFLKIYANPVFNFEKLQ